MLESLLCKRNGTKSQKNPITNFSTNRPEHFIPNQIDANNNQEFQNLVDQMILNLVAKTEKKQHPKKIN